MSCCRWRSHLRELSDGHWLLVKGFPENIVDAWQTNALQTDSEPAVYMLQVEVPSAGAVRWALGVSGERPP